MKTKYILSAIILISLAITLPSCTKWKENRSATPAIDHGIAQSTVHDLFRQALLSGLIVEGKATSIDDCLSFSNNNSDYPKNVTLNYGSENCKGPYDTDRKGTLNLRIDRKFSEVGAIIEISSSNYTVNDYTVSGTVTVTYVSNNSEGAPIYSISSGELTISSGESFSYNWAAERTYELVDGASDLNFIWNDIYSVKGTSSGTDRDGAIYSSEILNDGLSYAAKCRWPAIGKEKLMTQDRDDREIIYGTGDYVEECSNQANIKRGKKEKPFDLR